jgi:biopolymer transport protein TolR
MIPRRTRKAMNQINVVPYIDVMLVLLVIFMVTAPFINPSQVELPSIGKSAAAPVAPLEVVIRVDGSLLLRDRGVNEEVKPCRSRAWKPQSARARKSRRSSRW